MMKKPQPEDYGATVFSGIVGWHDLRRVNDYYMDLSQYHFELAAHYEKAIISAREKIEQWPSLERAHVDFVLSEALAAVKGEI